MIKDPGELNQKVQLLAPTVSYGSNGEPLDTWGDYGTRWAKIEPLGGTETVQTDIPMPVSRAKFTFRYNSDYTENFRLVWNQQTWNITNISFEGFRNEYTVMLAESNTSQVGDATAYGDYYSTRSLKIRQITASAVTTITPIQAELDSDIGLTAAEAGAGYICMIHIHSLSRNLLVESDGEYWYYAYVGTNGNLLDYYEVSCADGSDPDTDEVNAALGMTAVEAGAGYTCIIKTKPIGLGATCNFIVFSEGTGWKKVQSSGIG